MKLGNDKDFIELVLHAPAWMVVLAVLLATAGVVVQVVLFL